MEDQGTWTFLFCFPLITPATAPPLGSWGWFQQPGFSLPAPTHTFSGPTTARGPSTPATQRPLLRGTHSSSAGPSIKRPKHRCQLLRTQLFRILPPSFSLFWPPPFPLPKTAPAKVLLICTPRNQQILFRPYYTFLLYLAQLASHWSHL